MDKIYLITTVHIGDPTYQHGILCIVRRRTVGWFPTLKRAEEVVVNNEGDIYEAGHYDHCVIEEVVPGLYPHVTRKEWFRWKEGECIIMPRWKEGKYIITPRWKEGKYIITPRPDKIRAGNIGIV